MIECIKPQYYIGKLQTEYSKFKDNFLKNVEAGLQKMNIGLHFPKISGLRSLLKMKTDIFITQLLWML